jgi:phospholipid/cholesterol/gamma-HCH transport system permease protein
MDLAVTRIEDTFKGYAAAVQDFAQLCVTAAAGAFRRPWYVQETIYHMNRIGVGSIFIVVLTGIFTGMVLTLQGAIQLEPYGAVPYVSKLVSASVVRELGPVLAALMIAGRVGSGIASELATMQVTEQIDALRAEGTDPIKKLITTRLIASLVMVPVLTIITDGIAMMGGYLIAHFSLSIDTFFYWTWAFAALGPMDLVYGLLKPLVFGFIVCMVGCYAGITTSGGTVGVGHSTTHAMVTSSILILVSDFFMTKLFIYWGW